jgi:hypothetical protein
LTFAHPEAGYVHISGMAQPHLDSAECTSPGCDGEDHPVLEVHTPCHPGQDVDAFYDKRTGTVAFCCHRCRRFLCEMAVAMKAMVLQ